MSFFIWIESTPLSVWIRESPTLWAFPFVLFLHTLGLAMLVGINIVVNLWVLGFSPKLEPAPLQRLFGLMWSGFWINAVSGLLLLLAYPAKALTNPVFYLKLILIAAAVANLQWLRDRLFRSNANRAAPSITRTERRSAALTLCLWAGAILAGRFLAYTHSVLMASDLVL